MGSPGQVPGLFVCGCGKRGRVENPHSGFPAGMPGLPTVLAGRRRGSSGWTSRLDRPTKDHVAQGEPACRGVAAPGSRKPPVAAHSFWFYREAGGFVRKKKPLDPVRQAQKNRAYRIGYLIALAGIVCGFVWLELKPV